MNECLIANDIFPNNIKWEIFYTIIDTNYLKELHSVFLDSPVSFIKARGFFTQTESVIKMDT